MASLPLISSAFTVEKFSLDIRVSACTFAERRHIYVGRNLKVQMLLFRAFPHLSCLLFIRKIVGLYKYLIKNETVDGRAKLQWHKSTDSVRLRDFAACSSILTQQHIQHFERKKKIAWLLASLSATTNSTWCQTVCTVHCILCTGL